LCGRFRYAYKKRYDYDKQPEVQAFNVFIIIHQHVLFTYNIGIVQFLQKTPQK